MKKQVTFAERLHQTEASQSSAGMDESNTALKQVSINFKNTLNTCRPPAARTEANIQDVISIPTCKTITAGPFLKHAALTPAQTEYLYTIAGSYGGALVRSLITQHYMNVLHWRIHTGRRDDLVVTPAASFENENHHLISQSEVSSRKNHNRKTNTNAGHHGKSFLPKIPNKQARVSSTSPSKRRRTKKPTSPKIRRRPKRFRGKLLEHEGEEEEGLDDCLSDVLSSLSVGEWRDDTCNLLC